MRSFGQKSYSPRFKGAFYIYFLMGHPRRLFQFIFYLFKQTLQFLQQVFVGNVHPVYGAGIQTHDPQNMSLLT